MFILGAVAMDGNLHRPPKEYFSFVKCIEVFSLRPNKPPRRMSGAFSAAFAQSKAATKISKAAIKKA